jgi:D-alanyl-lipoteichoic acid acyltransferase DltB (MBOAT superfamily)
MLFQTWTFAAFFLIFYPVFLAVKETRLRLPWLLLASYVFYGWWNPLYPLLLLYATTTDYLAVVAMSRSRRKAPWLILSLANDLGLLGFFKYGSFVVMNLNGLLSSLHVPYEIPAPGILLPVGISFFLFQSMTYTIDYYRGNVTQEPSFLRYAAFVAMFPQLLSGPIERARNVLPQLRRSPAISRQDVADGLSLFVVGLFKKIALADYLALYVDRIYGSPGQFEAPALLLASFAYAWQIYFDFSGYTDIARGAARLLGVRLMLNFNNPYLADGLGDFWKRWHISLSTWFRDYFYIPLGGNRHGELATYRNMCLTMLVSGLWHGATWTFVIWGALHALGRTFTRALEASTFYRNRVPRPAKQLMTFCFVTFAWIFFRAESFADARLIVSRIAELGAADPRCPLLLLALVFAVWGYQFACESRLRNWLAWTPVRVGTVVLMVLCMAVFAMPGARGFIYFQF